MVIYDCLVDWKIFVIHSEGHYRDLHYLGSVCLFNIFFIHGTVKIVHLALWLQNLVLEMFIKTRCGSNKNVGSLPSISLRINTYFLQLQ